MYTLHFLRKVVIGVRFCYLFSIFFKIIKFTAGSSVRVFLSTFLLRTLYRALCTWHSKYISPLTANDVGDVCDGDIDDDGFDDDTDDCPKHRNITVIDFKTLILIPLDPQGASQMDPRWRILNNVRFVYLSLLLALFLWTLPLPLFSFYSKWSNKIVIFGTNKTFSIFT